MRRRFDRGAIWAFVVLGWRQARGQRLALLGQSALYVIVLAIFWQLWRATPLRELGPSGPSSEGLLWYLAITEWIVFAGGARYREIEIEVASGAIESALLRPLPHGLATLARWLGHCAYQLIILGAVGLGAGWWLTGSLPPLGALAPVVVLSSGLGLALVLLCHLQLGYAAVWIGSAAPAFWVWQKLLFVFGGLLFPLGLYPDLMRRLSEASPFAAMLFVPGSLVFGADAQQLAALVGVQLAWLGVLGAVTLLVGCQATRRLVGAP